MLKVLVMLPDNPGDVLMATPALRGLKTAGHEVHFLVDSANADLVRHNPRIDGLHLFPRRELKAGLNGPQWRAGLLSLKEFLGRLYHEKFDKVVNLFQGASTACLASLLDCDDFAGARYGRKGRLEITGAPAALMYSIPFARAYVPAHACDFYSLMCGVAPDGNPVELFLPEAALAFADGLVRKQGFTPGRIAVLHPRAAHAKKEWPASHMAALLRLLAGAGYDAVLTGSAPEKPSVDAIISEAGVGRAVNLCGAASFLESAAVMKASRCVVSGDTVAMHMAAAVGTRPIALFAPTSPLETGPYCASGAVFTAPCLCRGDYSGACSFNRRCSGMVTPEQVFEEIEGRLPRPAQGCRRLTPAFEAGSGALDYLEQGTSAYRPVSRALFNLFRARPLHAHVLTVSEEKTLERFSLLLQENANCLNMLKRLQSGRQDLTEWLKKNRSAERSLNAHSGAGALLSAFLRFRNNSIQAEGFAEMSEAMLAHARDLSLHVENLRTFAGTESVVEKAPFVSIIMTLEEGAPAAQLEALRQALDYPSFDITAAAGSSALTSAAAREAFGDYLLFLGRSVRPAPGALLEMVRLLEEEEAFCAVSGKLLDADDNVAGTGILRYSPEASRRVEMEAAPLSFLLVRKEAFTAAGADLDADFCGRLKAAGKGILYCPEAEAYFLP